MEIRFTVQQAHIQQSTATDLSSSCSKTSEGADLLFGLGSKV